MGFQGRFKWMGFTLVKNKLNFTDFYTYFLKLLRENLLKKDFF